MSRRRQLGFTLLELMVALVIGALVVTAVFMLGGASSRHFQEQQRVGVTQRSVRMAMDRLRRDIARAGYFSVPDTNPASRVRVCPQPALPRPVQAIWYQNDSLGTDAIPNAAVNRVGADQLRLTGNFATSEGYLVRSLNGAGNQVFLQTSWLGFRNTFVGASGTIDQSRVAAVFRPGNMLHIETRNGSHFFVDITGVTVAGGDVIVQIAPGLGIDNPCIRGLGRGSIVSPISQIQYSIATAGPDLAPNNVAVTGANTVLYRDVLDMRNGTVMQRQPILEYAIDFDLDFIVDQNTNPGLPPRLERFDGTDDDTETEVQTRSWRVRSVIASLAARTPEQDPRFAWPAEWAGGRPDDQPLNRFQVFPLRDGAARVRQLSTEVQMPNLIPR